MSMRIRIALEEEESKLLLDGEREKQYQNPKMKIGKIRLKINYNRIILEYTIREL
jgi:hypothetical protein